MNATGQVTDEQTRNGVETVSTRNPSTGWLLGQTVTSHADDENLVQGLKLKFDEAGNLRTRMRSEPRDMADSTETFGYDLLDRLTSSEVKVPMEGYDNPESFAYDTLGIGNLTQKGGKTYTYGGCGAGPHAVCKVGGGTAYAYDLNGNMTAGNDRTVSYNGANKVTRISHATGATDSGNADVAEFAYGADGNRVVQSVGTTTSGSTDVAESARTIYVGLGGTGKGIYERTTRGTTIEHVHFIYAGGAHGGNAFALRVVTEDSSATGQLSSTNTAVMKYNHFDHLGSVTATSDDMGKVVGLALGGANATAMGYDAWGAQRSPDGKAANPTTSYPLPVGHRQFTGHETIPNVGLVNMNGRVYDPELGRFLSPDPNVQFAADLQSYNRYTYAANNPLRYTDPTGYSWYSFLSSPTFWIGAFETVAGIVGCAYTGGALCLAWGAAMIAENSMMALSMGASWRQVVTSDVVSIGAMLVGGAVGGAITSGESGMSGAMLSGAIAGAVTAGITTPILGGSLGQNLLMGIAMGAMGGALQSSLQGTNPVSQAAEEQQGGDLSARKGNFKFAPWTSDDAYNHDPDVMADRQAQIDLAVKTHGYYFLEGKMPMYDPDLGTEGLTLSDGTVTIGPKGFNSEGYLTSTVEHESVHAEQIRDYGGFTEARTNVNEVQAYDRELSSAKANGLTTDEIARIQEYRQPYYDNLTTWQKASAWLGSY